MTSIKEALDVIKSATANCQAGDRHIVVLDRGWVFAGDLSQDKETQVYTLTNAVNIRKWKQGGFGALSKSATAAGATLDESAPIKFHASALILAVPISAEWE